MNRFASARKVLIVLGTRPEGLKLTSVYRTLQERPDCIPVLMNSGQHRATVDQTLLLFGIRCNIRASQIMGTSLLKRVMELCSHIRGAVQHVGPDVLVAQGDTATAYATALVSRDLGIPLAHVEAGLRTNHASRPFPEEYFRRRISRIASLHFAPTWSAARNLQREGVALSKIVRSGNTIIDLLRVEMEKAPAALPISIRKENRLITFTLHRRENQGKGIQQASSALKELIKANKDIIAVCPLPPNPATRLQLTHHLADHSRIHLAEPINYPNFIALLRRSSLAITDSGGIQEEAPHLGVPLLIVRQNTERVDEARLGGATLVSATAEDIYREAERILSKPRPPPFPFTDAAPNGDGSAGQRIADHLVHFAQSAASSALISQ